MEEGNNNLDNINEEVNNDYVIEGNLHIVKC